jgi:hypothetical protein
LERAMTRRIFQALPTQTDTTKTVAALFVTIDRQTNRHHRWNEQWLEKSSRHCPHRQTLLL